MKKKKIILIAIFVIGISFLLYPRIGNIITSYNQRRSIRKYVETIESSDKEKNQKLYEEAVQYNEKIYEYKKAKRRYNFEDEYIKTLKLNDSSIMGFIEIPKAKISLPIYHGVKENTLQKGVGHVRESSLPIGTTDQNSMLMGHSGLPISKIFTNLEKLTVGDYIKITVLDRKLYYEITEIEVIEPEDVIDKLKIEEGKDLITLVTCTPYGINSHRLIIRAERTKDAPEKQIDKMIKEATPKDTAMITLVIIGIIGLIALIVVIYRYLRKKKLEKERIEKERLERERLEKERKEQAKKKRKTTSKSKTNYKSKTKKTTSNKTKAKKTTSQASAKTKAKEKDTEENKINNNKKSNSNTKTKETSKEKSTNKNSQKKKKKKKDATKKRIKEKNNKKRGKKNAKKR